MFLKYSKKNKIKYLLDIVENSRSTWSKLYKAEVLKRNNINFFETALSEADFSFNVLVALYSKKINFLNKELYYYSKQIDSSITSKKDDFRINAINSFILLSKELEKRDLISKYKILKIAI